MKADTNSIVTVSCPAADETPEMQLCPEDQTSDSSVQSSTDAKKDMKRTPESWDHGSKYGSSETGIDDGTVETAEVKPSRGNKPSVSVKWGKNDTELLHTHFQKFFSEQDAVSSNAGRLPSKRDIVEFVRRRSPLCLQHLEIQEAYKKTRTKLFNERKTMQLNVVAHLKKLKNEI